MARKGCFPSGLSRGDERIVDLRFDFCRFVVSIDLVERIGFRLGRKGEKSDGEYGQENC